MSLAPDAASEADSGTNEGLSAVSWTHTCTGSQLYLFVGVALRQDAGQTVSSVTYNGVNLSFIGGVSNGSNRTELWGMVAPATGANTVTVTLSAVSAAIVCGAKSWTGADQTGNTSASTIGTVNTATATSSSVSNTVTSASGEIVQDAICVTALQTISSCGQTQDWNGTDGGGQFRHGAGSNAAGAASVSMTWTLSGSGAWASVAVPLKPASGGAALSRSLSFSVTPTFSLARVYSAARAPSYSTSVTFSLARVFGALRSTSWSTSATFSVDRLLALIRAPSWSLPPQFTLSALKNGQPLQVAQRLLALLGIGQ